MGNECLEASHEREVIHIAVAVNNAFARHAGVLITSLLARANQNFSYQIHVLCTVAGLDAINRSNLGRCCCERAGIFFHDVKGQFNDLPLTSYYKLETYYRLALPATLPDVDRCLYLDSDMVVLGDIATLWGINLCGMPLAAVRDHTAEQIRGAENAYRRLGVRKYYNGGVMLIDLKQWRRLRVVQECLSRLRQREYQGPMLEQDVLNVLLDGQVLFLDPVWNVGVGWFFSFAGIRRGGTTCLRRVYKQAPHYLRRRLAASPAIVHIGGGEWFGFPPRPGLLRYWKWVKATPWRADYVRQWWKMWLYQLVAHAVVVSVTIYDGVYALAGMDSAGYAIPYKDYSWE